MQKYRLLLPSFIVLLALAVPTLAPPRMLARKRCQVHGEVLKKVKVPISYGLVFDFVEPEARRELFPNANTKVRGGYVVEGGEPTEAAVYYCFQCRVAEYKYKKEYAERCNKSVKCQEKGWWRKRAA